MGSFANVPANGGGTVLLAKHTSIGVGVYHVTFLTARSGTTGGSGLVSMTLQVETSGGTPVSTAGPYTRCFDQITFVCADSVSGAWTYANNTATASFAIYGSGTGTNAIVCGAASFIQLTRIA